MNITIVCLSADSVRRRQETRQYRRMSSLCQKSVIVRIGMATGIILGYKLFEDRTCLRRETADTRR